MENNKVLEDIIKNLKAQKIDINDLSEDGISSISNMMDSLKTLPDFITDNIGSYPKEQRKLLDDILKDVKSKLTPEYIRKQTFDKL